MSPISKYSPGVSPLPEDLEVGQVVVVPFSSNPRLHVRKLQLCRIVGGSGLKRDSSGTSIFLRPLWSEIPMGRGVLTQTPGDVDYDYKSRRPYIVGLASEKLVRDVTQEPGIIQPGDPDDLCVLVACRGNYEKGDTIAQCMKALGIKSLRDAHVVVVHRESWVTEFGAIGGAAAYQVGGRLPCHEVHGPSQKRELEEAERYAATVIAGLRG